MGKHLQWKELMHKEASSYERVFLSKDDLMREWILICITWYKNHWKMGPVSEPQELLVASFAVAAEFEAKLLQTCCHPCSGCGCGDWIEPLGRELKWWMWSPCYRVTNNTWTHCKRMAREVHKTYSWVLWQCRLANTEFNYNIFLLITKYQMCRRQNLTVCWTGGMVTGIEIERKCIPWEDNVLVYCNLNKLKAIVAFMKMSKYRFGMLFPFIIVWWCNSKLYLDSIWK